MTPRRIIGVEKNYDWGDEVAIRQSLGLDVVPGTKVAEMWFGTHPQGPSHVDIQNGQLLSDIAGEMSMLVKLLSCQEPLSLQTHPTRKQAQDGFAKEEALGIPRNAPHRMYRDDSDKPEMIVALSRFEALCGFAPIEISTQLLHELGWMEQAQSLSTLGISGYLRWAFQQPMVPSFQRGPSWLQKICSLHPNDKALLIAPLMNHVILNQGEALCLPAGNLHAYLDGFGLEVMSSSDNVIRAGFTSKHVDVEEVLRIVDTRPLESPIVHIGDDGIFPSPSPAFTVARATTSSRFVDHHRIAFGKFSDSQLPHKEMCFLQAGDNEELTDAHGYVCIQN